MSSINLNTLSRKEVQNLAKQNNIPANIHTSEIIKKLSEIYKLKQNSKLSQITRLDTLPHDLQNKIFKELYKSANPEIEEKIRIRLEYNNDRNFITFSDKSLIKIREFLKLKHSTNNDEINNKVDNFYSKYINNDKNNGLLNYYFEIDDLIATNDFEEIEEGEYKNKLLAKLKKYTDKYNKIAKILKNDFDFYIKKDIIEEINSLIKSLNNNNIFYLINP